MEDGQGVTTVYIIPRFSFLSKYKLQRVKNKILIKINSEKISKIFNCLTREQAGW